MKSVVIPIVLFAFSLAWSDARYIRAGANGSGSSWTDALPALPSTLSSGDTCYIADGDYGACTIGRSAGTGMIVIKKATISDHGSNAGWQDAWGDGVASWSGVTITASHVELDGVTGGGPGNWNSGFGFEISRTTSACRDNGALIAFPQKVTGVSVRHVRMFSGSKNYPLAGVKGVAGADSLVFSRVSIHTIFGVPFHIGNWENIIMEYSSFADNRSTGATDTYCPNWHSEGISSIGANRAITIRYNLWHSIAGTAVFAGVNNGSSIDWKIYGNVFSRSVTTIYYYASGNDQQVMNNLEFYNNTICGIPNVSMGGLVMQAGSNNRVFNNIWYNNVANSLSISGTHDYNYFSRNRRVQGCNPPCDRNAQGAQDEAHSQVTDVNPFTVWDGEADPGLSDISLNAPTQAGMPLGDEFAYDMFGNRRGDDGVWDRGAVEYAGPLAATRPDYRQSGAPERRSALYPKESACFDFAGRRIDGTGVMPKGVYLRYANLWIRFFHTRGSLAGERTFPAKSAGKPKTD